MGRTNIKNKKRIKLRFQISNSKLYSTFKERHLDSDQCGEISPTPTMVPMNLILKKKSQYVKKIRKTKEKTLEQTRQTQTDFLSGESSPSNLILKRMPTENPLLIASRYLFTPIMN